MIGGFYDCSSHGFVTGSHVHEIDPGREIVVAQIKFVPTGYQATRLQ